MDSTKVITEKSEATASSPTASSSTASAPTRGARQNSLTQNASGGRLGQSAAAKASDSQSNTTADTLKKSSPVKKMFGQQALSANKKETAKVIESTYTQVSSNMNFEQRRLDLVQLEGWDFSGRIGITVEKDAYNGSLDWKQTGDDLDFRFRGPLGIGGVRIHGTLGEQVRVKSTRGDEFFLTDIEKDLEEQMGWQLPISSLRYWVLGITDPNFDTAVEVDENDLLVALEQEDWEVSYDQYMDVNGQLLPKKLKVVGPKTKIRLVVSEWSITK